jgi:hypothetical protein
VTEGGAGGVTAASAMVTGRFSASAEQAIRKRARRYTSVTIIPEYWLNMPK